MPDAVTITNGKAEMAYTGAKPWHGLGTQVQQAMTAEEALQAASLDWEVTTRPIYLSDNTKIEDHVATVRQDTKAVLGIVGHRYTPLQNRDAFSFLDSMVGEKAAMYETVGSLHGGRRVWLLAKLPESVAVAGKDVIDQYLLLANGHDGSLALTVQFTPVRVVCNNTLTAALSKGSKFRSLHTVNIKDRTGEAQRVLGLASSYFENFVRDAEMLTRVQFNTIQTCHVLGEVYHVHQDRLNQIRLEGGKLNNEKALLESLRLAEEGVGNEQFPGTAWALYNGITEYLDHHRPVKTSTRTEGSWFGTEARVRQRAWDLITAVATR